METQKYPVVPGHEIAGIVKEVGSNVQRFKVGDHMGVGTHVNSCRDCEYCNDRFNGVGVDGTIAKGGYSSHIVVHEGKLSIGFGSSSTLCWNYCLCFDGTPQDEPTCTSISKKEKALSQLGADNFVVSSDRNQMKALVKSVDFIIDIASVKISPANLNIGMKTISGSVTGGTKDIQEMIDFCAANGIHPMIEIIPIQSANEAIERLLKSVVIYRSGLMVGFPSEVKISPANLHIGMKTFSGSVTGGTKDIQEMIDFFASNGIHPMIEKFQFNLQMKLLRGY
ncbi:unnamed protein product [Prunus armeniaca]|uniref:Alcohol dehydrogenase-like N-terminal domain-containing protein n=1 Tax=Prunus armeniaca TaxID=36596 RepID=A0A6J5U166_PRUAR|nr:unnamed protein product [Prunus armeniaca]